MTEERIPLTKGAEADQLVRAVRDRYGRIATAGASCCGGEAASCCGTSQSEASRGVGYQAGDLASVPEEADLGLGCGAPIPFLALEPGETVLDLGSGPGLDAFLAARAVGAHGGVIGVDMTHEMLERARATARKVGFTQVEFREGRLEKLPVADGSVDAVTSNCVINLVPDKAAVFGEVARVLRAGGRLVISDIVLDGELLEAIGRDLLAYVGCISGAIQRGAYFALVERAGLAKIEVLRDIDALAAFAAGAPEEAKALSERTGVRLEDVRGKVRSVTYRAWKP
jgi:arsenite methyltransferase